MLTIFDCGVVKDRLHGCENQEERGDVKGEKRETVSHEPRDDNFIEILRCFCFCFFKMFISGMTFL